MWTVRPARSIFFFAVAFAIASGVARLESGTMPGMFGSLVSAQFFSRIGRTFLLPQLSQSPFIQTGETNRYRPPVTAAFPASLHRICAHRPDSRGSTAVIQPAASLALSGSRLKWSKSIRIPPKLGSAARCAKSSAMP